MQNPHYRYFIELHSPAAADVPRRLEAETRRAAALGYIEVMQRWLKECDLAGKVSALSVTMFGQVQITCDSAIIKLIRNREDADIAAIRQGALGLEAPRWNEAH
jgi:hypothetical protein